MTHIIGKFALPCKPGSNFKPKRNELQNHVREKLSDFHLPPQNPWAPKNPKKAGFVESQFFVKNRGLYKLPFQPVGAHTVSGSLPLRGLTGNLAGKHEDSCTHSELEHDDLQEETHFTQRQNKIAYPRHATTMAIHAHGNLDTSEHF